MGAEFLLLLLYKVENIFVWQNGVPAATSCLLFLPMFSTEKVLVIRSVDPDSFSLLDPDPGWKIFQIKTEKNARKLFFQFFKVNLHKLHCFLLLSNLTCFLQLQKPLEKFFL